MGLALSTSAAIIGFCVIFVDAQENVRCIRALNGMTGVGKSWISTMNGCESKTCSGSRSCTKDYLLCPNGIMDNIGAGDDGIDGNGGNYEVDFEGQKIELSGLLYPVWTFLKALEEHHIDCVEHFFVVGAENPKFTGASTFLRKYIQEDMKCPLNLVVNKFDPARTDHQGNVRTLMDEGYSVITVGLNAATAPLKSSFPPCRIALSPDWKLRVLDADLAASISRIDVTACDIAYDRLVKFRAIMEKVPKTHRPASDCSRRVVVAYAKAAGSSFCMGSSCFRGKEKVVPIENIILDPECVRRDVDEREAIKNENQQLTQEKIAFADLVDKLDATVNQCLLSPNWRKGKTFTSSSSSSSSSSTK